MRLTDTDKDLFEALNQSALGKQLIDYLTRLQADICDVRNIGDTDIAGVKFTADKIQSAIIDKISKHNAPLRKNELNPHE